MPKQRKRTIEEVDAAEPSAVQRNIKSKPDAAATESNISDTSYISAATAIFSESDSGNSTETAQTDVEDSGSEDSSSSEEDSSDESSSSSDEDSDDGEEQEQEEITNVRPGTKPEIRRVPNVGVGLLDRLRSFLPEMEKANEELEKEREAGTLGERSLEVTGEEEGQYIEMNLGLGVLEEKREGVEHNESEEEEDDDDSAVNSDTERGGVGGKEKEKDILGDLMGQKTRLKPVSIEVIEDD